MFPIWIRVMTSYIFCVPGNGCVALPETEPRIPLKVLTLWKTTWNNWSALTSFVLSDTCWSSFAPLSAPHLPRSLHTGCAHSSSFARALDALRSVDHETCTRTVVLATEFKRCITPSRSLEMEMEICLMWLVIQYFTWRYLISDCLLRCCIAISLCGTFWSIRTVACSCAILVWRSFFQRTKSTSVRIKSYSLFFVFRVQLSNHCNTYNVVGGMSYLENTVVHCSKRTYFSTLTALKMKLSSLNVKYPSWT